MLALVPPLHRPRPRLGWLVSAVLALGAASCMPRGELAASDGSRRMVARDPQTGVSVVLTLGAWDGSPSGLDHDITVVHALVANMGSEAVRLAPGDIDLFDERGFRRELMDAGGSFVASGEQDRGYHPGRGLAFGRIEWNGGDVGATALPWGMLRPGTQMRGYLYFQRLDNAGNAGTLTWHFHGEKGQPLVDLAFDIYVVRQRG